MRGAGLRPELRGKRVLGHYWVVGHHLAVGRELFDVGEVAIGRGRDSLRLSGISSVVVGQLAKIQRLLQLAVSFVRYRSSVLRIVIWAHFCRIVVIVLAHAPASGRLAELCQQRLVEVQLRLVDL